ncbi:AAA family ATPase [Streptomyces sp. CC228A]|uniref:ATP-binding protein n=1 Tax=Streptomyces sp. CC228A TaxID=2898186 RepID=UPI001F32886C|nr:AAA family ATPase [Streptomyces sp. CC228A]
MTEAMAPRGSGEPLLERESELLAIQRALDALCGTRADGTPARRGGLLAFTGPAGAGKTTLVNEVRHRAAERGCTVLFARGGEQEKQVPFRVMRHLVQPLLAPMGEAECREVLGNWYTIVAPAIGLDAPTGDDYPDPQGVRDGLDWVVTRLAVRHDRPLVLVLDDAHWADSESLAWLTAFAARAEELAMLIVVACRPDDILPDAAALQDLTERHAARPHELAPLTSGAVAMLVRSVLGEDADEVFCRELWAITAGSPFEVVELLQKSKERGLKAHEDALVQLRDLASAVKGSGLIDRLEQFGPSTVRVAWAAAVLGSSGIPMKLLGTVSAFGEAQAAAAVAELEGARLLTAVTSIHRERVVEFNHPLIANAVYGAMPPGVRVAMHGVAARALIDAGYGPSEAARHLLETHPEGDPWVVRILRQAARDSFSSGAPEPARRYLGRALREPPDVEERAEVLFELGSANLPHEPAATVNQLRAALEEPKIGQPLREAITYRLAQALVHSGQMERAIELLEEAAQGTTDSRTRLRMQAEQFKWNSVRVDEPDAPARSRRLARFAERLTGRGPAERLILGMRAWDAVLRGESAAEALHHAEEALTGGMTWIDQDFGFEVPAGVALVLMYCDQPGRAEELFNAGIAEFEARGWRGAHLSFAYTLFGYLRYRRGRLSEAEDFVRSGLEIADRVGHGIPAQRYAVGILVETLLARGRVAEAQSVADDYGIDRWRPDSVVYPDPQAVHGRLLAAQGRLEEAERQLTAAGARLDRRGSRNPAWSPWQLDLALVQTAAGRGDTARATADEALARARAFGTAGIVGHALRVCATAAADPGRAIELLEQAVAHLEQSPAAYELAYALVDHGTVLRTLGRMEQAALQLYRGLETAAACGADPLVARAREQLAAAGLRPRRPQATGGDTLTAPEATAARHAADGLGNAAIAAAMHLPEHTVRELLSGVFAKLGTDRIGLTRALGG